MTVVVTHTTPADGTFSATGAAAWNANHALAGVGTMAEQNANAVAITGGTINNTTIGATTPSTGVFTTLTAQTEVLKGTGQNLVLYSQDYTNASWAKSNLNVTASGATAPDSTSTAITVLETVTNGTHNFATASSISSASGSNYTISFYLKANGRNFCAIYDGASAKGKFFNITAGGGGSVLGNLIGAPVSAALVYVGNDWYRASIVVTASSTIQPAIYLSTDGTTFSYAGNVSLGVLVWGAQLEIGSVLNTYIPTTTTAVYGTPTLSFSGVASIGLQSDGSLYETSAGTGNVRFYTNNIGQEQARVSHTASAVNYHQLTGSATGSGPIHSVAGSDTNIDLNLTPKGTGTVVANGPFTATGQTSLGTGSTRFWTASGASTTPTFIASGNNAIFGVAGTGTTFIQSSTSTSQLAVAHTASAVNYVQVTGGSTGNAPYFISQGSDTNVNLWYGTKGTGYHAFFTAGNGANVQFLIANTASAVNYVQTSGSTTGFGAKIFSAGSDTNIPLVLQPKGTGALQAQQTDSTATGGNARGANAVDWQTSRTAASQVANGSAAVIGGGQNNVASVLNATVGGGLENRVSGGYGTISGGYNNSVSGGGFNFLGGGSSNTNNGNTAVLVGGSTNSSSGFYNIIVGGWTNSGTANAAVTTQSGTMNGTTAVTLSGSNASIKVGQYIQGTSIASDTYVAAVSGTSLTLSKVASGSSTSTLSFFTPHGVVVGGGNNQATGSYSFIGGGGDAGTAANRNVASGDWSVVGGGWKNVASGNGSFIGGGGYLSGSPFGNTASGQNAIVVGGVQNTTSGQQSFIGGGYNNTANGVNSVIVGSNNGTTRSIDGFNAFPASNGPISGSSGVQQSGLLVLGVQTTDATATVLRSNTSAASTVNQVILPNNSAYAFSGTVIANVTGGGNTKAWAIEGAIKRGANAASTALVGTPTVTSAYADVGAATWAIAVTADTTNGGLAVTFTGQAATTIRCVAKLETTEVTF